MAVSYVKDEDWLTRNMGYDLAINQLDQRVKYLQDPAGFLGGKSQALTQVKDKVGTKFTTIFEALAQKGVPDVVARQLAINAAQQQGQIDSIMMGLEFPEQLFGDAARATYGEFEARYPDTNAAAAIVGNVPSIGYTRKYKKSKKNKKGKKKN